MADNFRTLERKSSLRANIFFLECTAVLAMYMWALFNNHHNSNDFQTYILAFCGLGYMLRLNVMARYLLQRELAMEELTVVILLWLPAIMASFAKVKRDGVTPVQLITSLVLYLVGSFLNSYSELERKWWKQIPKNKGRCYTRGLFAWSRNINYFGDTMLFAGWALSTGVWWNAWVPLTMGLSFYFHHIPDKETYLKKRYSKDWPSYKEQTPYAFIPFVC